MQAMAALATLKAPIDYSKSLRNEPELVSTERNLNTVTNAASQLEATRLCS